jgi:hypothetical protein
MAQKSAQIDAILRTGSLSDYFNRQWKADGAIRIAEGVPGFRVSLAPMPQIGDQNRVYRSPELGSEIGELRTRAPVCPS